MAAETAPATRQRQPPGPDDPAALDAERPSRAERPTDAEPEAAPTDDRLLDEAEALFAHRGIDGVSVRAITRAAGANLAAVHYHFGSKDGLVRALVQRRVAEVGGHRAAMLDALERAEQVSPRDVAEAWVRPLAHLALDPTGARQHYVPFLAMLQAGGPERRALAREAFAPQFARLADLLARALDHVDEPTRHLRFAIAADATIRALADPERLAAPWRDRGDPVTPAVLVDILIDTIAGTLAGPPRRSP